mgnify:CR=1 FL=1
MGGQHIFCYNCVHFDSINLCKTRHQFVKAQKGRYCQDFVDKARMDKPKEEIPQPVKPLEEVGVAPVKTQLELSQIKEEMKPKKLTWWQKILKFLLFWRVK